MQNAESLVTRTKPWCIPRNIRKKIKKLNDHLAKQREKQKEDINKFLSNNEQLCKSLRDLKDRSCCDNLRIDILDKVENETWEQTE